MGRRILLLCLFIPGTVWGVQQVATLDLTNARTRTRMFEPVTGSAGGTGIGSGVAESLYRPRQSLELTLTNVERTQQGGVKTLVYEIKLKNVADEAVRIPWDPSPRDIEPSPPKPYGYELASPGMMLLMPSGETKVLEAPTIYGSESSNTLRALLPGEWVSIRAETKLRTLNGDFTEESRVSMLRATWNQYRATVDGSPSKFHETLISEGTPIQSQNTLPMPKELSNQK